MDFKNSLPEFELFPIKGVNPKRRFGYVYGGLHLESNQKVKVKLIQRDNENSGYIFEQIVAEKLLSESLLRNNICGFPTLQEIIEIDDFIYLLYPYIDGVPISKLKLKLKDLKNCYQNLVLSLNIIHNLGFLHGDIKPENIIVYYKEGVLIPSLIDFGQCIQIGKGSQYIRPFTMLYSAPELVLDYPELANASTDYYSLAITFYELIIGKILFNHRNPEMIIAMMLNYLVGKKELNELPQNWNEMLSIQLDKQQFRRPPRHLQKTEIIENLVSGIRLRENADLENQLNNLEENFPKKWWQTF